MESNWRGHGSLPLRAGGGSRSSEATRPAGSPDRSLSRSARALLSSETLAGPGANFLILNFVIFYGLLMNLWFADVMRAHRSQARPVHGPATGFVKKSSHTSRVATPVALVARLPRFLCAYTCPARGPRSDQGPGVPPQQATYPGTARVIEKLLSVRINVV